MQYWTVMYKYPDRPHVRQRDFHHIRAESAQEAREYVESWFGVEVLRVRKRRSDAL